jgi:hypothetical protein
VAEVEDSLAFPGDMVFSSNGQRVYVTGFGSEKIGIFDTDDLEAGTITKTLVEVGAGPSGIVLDEARNQAYVMNRIDHTISIVSNANTPATAAETVVIRPLRPVAGRREGRPDLPLRRAADVGARRPGVRELPRLRRLRQHRVGPRRSVR